MQQYDVTFKACTRDGCRKAVRRLRSANSQFGWVTVTYNGWQDFRVMLSEIIYIDEVTE